MNLALNGYIRGHEVKHHQQELNLLMMMISLCRSEREEGTKRSDVRSSGRVFHIRTSQSVMVNYENKRTSSGPSSRLNNDRGRLCPFEFFRFLLLPVKRFKRIGSLERDCF